MTKMVIDRNYRPMLSFTALTVSLVSMLTTNTASADSPMSAQQGLIDQTLIDQRLPTSHGPGPLLKFITAQLLLSDSTAERDPKTRTSKTISVQVEFAFDSVDLSREAIEQLHPLGQALRSPDLNRLQFLVEGHTDSVGDADYNLRLSKQRAESVKQHLIDYYQLAPTSLDVVGRGETDLLDVGNPASAANRRVRIVSQN